MKNKIAALLLCLTLLLGCTCNAEGAFVRQYGSLVPYTNLVWGFSFDVYSQLYQYSEDQLNSIWNDMEQDENDDQIYDLRYWLSLDSRFMVEVQVKEPTYANLEEEIANAPGYLALIRPDLEAQGYTELTQIHNGVVRSTPVGDMLETAISYRVNGAQSYTVTQVYYDYYIGSLEYIFLVVGYDTDYNTVCSFLEPMMANVSVWSVDQQV